MRAPAVRLRLATALVAALPLLAEAQEGGTAASPVDAEVAALIARLEDTNRSVRWDAVRELMKLGPKARAAGPALIRLLAQVSEAEKASGSSFHRDLEQAIAATGAGRTDDQLAAEDEMRAAVVAAVLEEWERTEGRRPAFTVSVFGRSPSETLLSQLARRGLAPAPETERARRIGFGLVEWIAGDMARVSASVDRDREMGGNWSVVLDGRRWRAVSRDWRRVIW